MPLFSDNTDWLTEVNGDTIDLPLRGKVFHFAGAPSLREGAELHEMRRKIEAVARGDLPANTIVIEDQRDLYVRLIGDQYDALAAAGATEADLTLIGSTLLNTYLYGADAGEQTWSGALQKALTQDSPGEAKPTGTRKTATPKATKPSPGGTPTTASSR